MSNDFLWCEKYRPSRISDCILPQSLRDTFTKIADGTTEVPNMIFSGTAGVGKTTVARALCEQRCLDYIVINGSEEGNIDTLRGKIKQFASTVSLLGGYKVVILDEADYLNPQSTQPALRAFIEEFSQNCRFIMTCNFKNRIIEPLHSRCSVYEFNIPPKEKPAIASKFLKRLEYVLEQEGVEYNTEVLVNLIMKFFPDWRRVLNECQRYSVSGTIDTGILVSLSDENMNTLVESLKDKNFTDMRKWVANNMDVESRVIYRKIYDAMMDILKPESVPQVVLILAQYQYYDAFVADHELNIVACMTEIMASAEFK
jgi:DNA polymerase III delta prime subunit